MNLTKIASVFVAVLLVATAGAAAMPGNAPADSQAGQADDNYDGSADDPAADAANASDAAAQDEMAAQGQANESDAHAAAASADQRRGPPSDADERRGPPTDMPEQVPDFVTQIHDLVNQKLDGTIDSLGEMIADVTPGDEQSDQAADGDAADQSDDEMNDEQQTDDENADGQQTDGDAESEQ